MHGNVHRTPSHATSFERNKFVISFLTNYAKKRALPSSKTQSQLCNRELVLPVGHSKHFVFQKYEEACHQENTEPVGERTFLRIWKSCCSHIVTHKP